MHQRWLCCGVLILACGFPGIADDDLRQRLKDANGEQTDVWIYNDIQQAMKGRRKNRRKTTFCDVCDCVLCKNCAAFDVDVANGNERVRSTRQRRIYLRSASRNDAQGVDLSLFQFDHDLELGGHVYQCGRRCLRSIWNAEQ